VNLKLPSIVVATPSFNQAPFLEATIRSVIDQNYPSLEYVVMDGASTDGSVEILERYSSRLTAWRSEPDDGQFHAVGKCLALGRGEIMGWINSDDVYVADALEVVGEVFTRFPQIEWLTTLYPLHLDERGRIIRADQVRGFSKEGFMAGEHLPEPGAFALGHIQQESTFWRRSLWERIDGRIDPEFPIAGDVVLWAQFCQHAELVGLAAPLAAFRIHGAQRIARAEREYHRQGVQALIKYGGHPGNRSNRLLREVASRMPFASHRALERLGVMRRASVVEWDITTRDWKMEDRFV